MGVQGKVIRVLISSLMSLMSVERVFKFVGSVPQGDDVKRKDLLVCFLRSATDSNRYVDTLETWEMCLCKKGVYFLKVK